MKIASAQIDSAGGLTAPARILTELLSALPEGDVAISVDLPCSREDGVS